MKRIAELSAPVTPEAMERDLSSYVEFLADSGHRSTKERWASLAIASLGVMACEPPQVIRTKSPPPLRFTASGSSPTLPQARIYCCRASRRDSILRTPSRTTACRKRRLKNSTSALEAWGGEFESEVYEDAYHGWTAPDSPVYNEPQADRAFQKLTELFAETLS